MIVYVYDGSFEGMLTCVYEGYYSNIKPEAIFSTYQYEGDLLHEAHFVITDPEKAFKVSKAIVEKLSEEFFHKIVNAFFSEDRDVATHIYKLLRFAFKVGPEVIKHGAMEVVTNVTKLSTAVARETHLFVGLVRFVELKGGVYYCQFAPTYNQVPLLAEHFTERMHNQVWVIHDIERNIAVFYDTKSWYVNEFFGMEDYPLSDDELLYQALWQTFHQKIAIEERLNPRCQRSFMPKKYWKYLTEFQ